jgi:hypothetical protein
MTPPLRGFLLLEENNFLGSKRNRSRWRRDHRNALFKIRPMGSIVKGGSAITTMAVALQAGVPAHGGAG